MESDFFSLPGLSRAIEMRDSKALCSFYSDNAHMKIIDRDHPPSHPQELFGQKAIAAFFDDVCGRTMTHKVKDGFLDSDHLAFTQDCAYPNGSHVFVSATAKLKNGKIVDETIVQAWDA